MVRALASHARSHWFKSSTAHAEVAEWQTRYVQDVVSIRMCGFKSHLRHHAPVAQRIERSPAEAEAVGSNPTRRAMKGRLAQWLEHLFYTQGVSGSSPLSPTIQNNAKR